jgi:type IV pilus assembly protein PilC
VEIGQASGRLEEVLSALSAYYRRESATQSAIRRAVAYPCLMAVLIALVFLILMARVLPVFRQVFEALGMTFSPVAAAMLRFGSASQTAATVLSLLLVLCALVLFFLYRSRRGAAVAQKLGYALFGNAASGRAVARSRFSSAMALMLSSGLPLDEAMDRTARLLEGSPLEAQLMSAQEKMSAGNPFPAPWRPPGFSTRSSPAFSPPAFARARPKRRCGNFPSAAGRKPTKGLRSCSAALNNALVLILCVSVGFVLLSVMLPLLGAMSAIGA